MKSTTYTIEIEYKGYDLSVHGVYTPGERDTRDTQGCSSRFAIDKVELIEPLTDPDPDNLWKTDVDYRGLEERILEKHFE